MRSFLFFVALVVFGFHQAVAQIRDDTEARRERGENIPYKTNWVKNFTYAFNVYTSGWTKLPPGIEVKQPSLGYSMYIQYKAALRKPFVTLMIGAGAGYSDYRFNGKVFYTESLDSTYFMPMKEEEYKRNKMSLAFFDVPVELRFSGREKRKNAAFYVAPGFSAGLLYNDYVKTTSEDPNGDPTKVKTFYTRNLLPYRYGPTLRIGYGSVGLFGYYGLSELFESGKGFGTNFYHAGITFGGY